MSVIKGDDLNQKRKDHAKLSNLDFANSGHTGFLGLDQTTTQTIINGIPLLTGLTPTTDYQIATKKYVDDAVEVENLWDRVGTVLSPHIANDSIDIGSGNIDTTGTLTGINITSGANPGHTHTSTSLPNVETLTTALTAGSVVFSDGTTLSQDNANIFWDIANKRLGIGTATPTSALDVVGGASGVAITTVSRATAGQSNSWVQKISSIYTGNLGSLYLQPTIVAADLCFTGSLDALVPQLTIQGSTGNLGIGTATPTSALQLGQNTGSNFLTLAGGTTGNSYGLNWTFTAPGTNIYSQIQLDYDTRVTRGLQINANAAYPTSFNTIDSTGGFVANIVTIDNTNGRVGIGLVNPASTLDVVGSADFRSGSVSLTIGADSSLTTRTDATSKYGRIGAAHYTNAEEPMAVLLTSSTSSYNQVSFGGGSGLLNCANILSFHTAANTTTTGASEKMRLDSVGLGIGTTTPTTELDVNGVIRSRSGTLALTDTKTDAAFVLPTGSSIYSLRESGGNLRNLVGVSSTGEITIGQSGTSLVPSITLEAGSVGYVSIVPGGGEAIRVLTTGNVGIGTTTPTKKLEVNGNVLSDQYELSALNTAPASATDTGTLGEIRVTADAIYICIATDVWVKSDLATR